jgi:general secretion pathway protein A
MDVLRHWGLSVRPFEATFDPRFFYESDGHAEAVARMRFLAEERSFGFGLLTGEIGSGKTFAASVFACTLDPRRFAPAFLEGSGLGFECVLDQLNCRLRGERPTGRTGSRYELLVGFRELLEAKARRRGLHLVLVLDEAQELRRRDLSDLRGLSNTAPPGAMSIVLVGQPELRDGVRSLPALDTRIGLRFHLRHLAPEEAKAYVLHRLRAAGLGQRRLFTDDALALLAGSSGGVPRELNRLAKLSLHRAAARGGRLVLASDVGSVAADAAAHAA